MNKDKLKNTLKRPRGLFLALVYILTVLFAAAAIALALSDKNGIIEILSYVSYALAAIFLGYSVYTVIIYAKTAKVSIKSLMKKNAILSAITKNYGVKTLVFSTFSFAFTVAFASINVFGAIKYRLVWYASVAGYYFVLLLLRGGIILSAKKLNDRYDENTLSHKIGEWRVHLLSGVALIILELSMAVAVTQMLLSSSPVQKSEIMAIATAAYTFYKMTMTVYNLVKAKKYKAPIVQSLRCVNFADACLSMVSLTVLMLSTFGGGIQDLLVLKAIVGFAACAAVIAVAVFIIVDSAKNLKSLKGVSINERG